MASIKGMPAVMPGAKGVALFGAAVATDVLALLLPGANTAHQAIVTLIERRMRSAQDALLEALRGGAVEVLTQAEFDFAIPSAFRFYQAARDGEAAHNLKILAEILVGRIRGGRLDPSDYSRICRQVEGLSISDLAALSAVVAVDLLHNSRKPDTGDFRQKLLTDRLIPHFFGDLAALGSSLAILAGRGLIVPDLESTWDAKLQGYLPGPTVLEIEKIARGMVGGDGSTIAEKKDG